MATGRKNIAISNITHSKLMELGKYGESMDDIVNRLIESYNKVNTQANKG